MDNDSKYRTMKLTLGYLREPQKIQNTDTCDEFQVLSPRLNVQNKPLKA